MKQIMQRFDNKPGEPSVQDLRKEILLLKEEIKQVKTRLNNMEINTLHQQLLKGEHENRASTSTNMFKENEQANDDIRSSLNSPRYGSETSLKTYLKDLVLKIFLV